MVDVTPEELPLAKRVVKATVVEVRRRVNVIFRNAVDELEKSPGNRETVKVLKDVWREVVEAVSGR